MAEFWREGRKINIGLERVATFADRPPIHVLADSPFPGVMASSRLNGRENTPIYLAVNRLSPESSARFLSGKKLIFNDPVDLDGKYFIDTRTPEEVLQTRLPGQVPDQNGAFKIPRGEEGTTEGVIRSAIIQAIYGSSVAFVEEQRSQEAMADLMREHDEQLSAYGLKLNTPDDQESFRGAVRFAIEVIIRNPRSFFDGFRVPEVSKAVSDLRRIVSLVEGAPKLPPAQRNELLNRERTGGPAAVWSGLMRLVATQQDTEKRLREVPPHTRAA